MTRCQRAGSGQLFGIKGKYVFPFCRILLSSNEGVICCTDTFTFMRYHLLSVLNLGLSVSCSESPLMTRSSNLIPIFSSTKFISGLMLRSSIYLEMSLSRIINMDLFFLLHVAIQPDQQHLLKTQYIL